MTHLMKVLSGMEQGMGTMVARKPGWVVGSCSFFVGFAIVSSNALYSQSGNHPGPIVTTRMTFNQSLDVSVDSSSSVLQEAALITDTTYSLSESEINEAVTNKRGQGNFTLTYLDPVSDTWSSPTHGVKATWSEPSMPLSPGGADNRYHHDGKYFIGPPQKIESTLQELCGRNNNCKDRKRQIYQVCLQNYLPQCYCSLYIFV